VAGTVDEKLVAAVLDNWRTAPVSEKMRSTLGFLEKLTTNPGAVGPGDLEPLRAAGVSDKAIEEAIYVCFLFSVMDRLADAFDFDLHSPQDFKRGGQVLYNFGYSRLSIPG
jgi:alkylhydroperoxidase family enzyme